MSTFELRQITAVWTTQTVDGFAIRPAVPDIMLPLLGGSSRLLAALEILQDVNQQQHCVARDEATPPPELVTASGREQSL